jgi:hypothetical protein
MDCAGSPRLGTPSPSETVPCVCRAAPASEVPRHYFCSSRRRGSGRRRGHRCSHYSLWDRPDMGWLSSTVCRLSRWYVVPVCLLVAKYVLPVISRAAASLFISISFDTLTSACVFFCSFSMDSLLATHHRSLHHFPPPVHFSFGLASTISHNFVPTFLFMLVSWHIDVLPIVHSGIIFLLFWALPFLVNISLGVPYNM